MTTKASRAATTELLAKVRLLDRKDAPVVALSGGMAQRLMVARAIMHRPQILFLDEPTAGLDPQSRIALWEIVGELHREGQTILLTTHYMEEADQLCQRVAIMDHGRILALDTPEGLKRSVGAERVFTLSANGDLDVLAARLASEIPGVVSARRLEGHVIVEVGSADGVLGSIITSAEAAGAELTDIAIAEPTLENVFIHLTGKDLRE
jgi:ABC-2 type transport system ATP-binding protein